MPTPAERAQAQALYLKEIHAKAKKIYDDKVNKPHLPIDPQGRVIIDVKLDDDAWERIYRALNPVERDEAEPMAMGDEVIEKGTLDQFKLGFRDILGHPIQEVTSVSLDLQTQSNEEANEDLSSSLKAYLPQEKATDILKAYQGLAKGRIISLQQETHFHAHLIERMLKTAVKKGESQEEKQTREKIFGDTDIQFQKGIENALLKLNARVMELHAKALEKAYKAANKKPFDQEKFAATLNEELDNARKKLLPAIAKEIRIKVIQATGIQFNEEITKHLSKHLAEATSGSANDFVHIDKGTGFISFIGASEHTSHHQELGRDHLADRIMYSHHLQDNDVVPLSHRQQIRVPSIAVKRLHPVTEELLEQDVKQKNKIPNNEIQDRINAVEKKLSEEERQQIFNEYQQITQTLSKYDGQPDTDEKIKWTFNQIIVGDTVEKLSHLQTKYNLGGEARSSAGSQFPQAFIYNLYTTLNLSDLSGAYDEKNNLQSQSAAHILVAAHEYNRANAGKPLCLVQNIAVNGWGYELSLQNENPLLVKDAALMTQMASLHTIYDSLHSEDKDKVNALFNEYEAFLRSPSEPFYNYLKRNQPNILNTLQELRGTMKVPDGLNSATFAEVKAHRNAFVTDAKAALVSLFKEGAFEHHENGFTYQALSVFVEKSSIGGCKSANERAQAVNGRVSILDFVSLDKNTRDDLLNNYLSVENATRLKRLADSLEQSIYEKNTAQIRENMDALYGSLNLEGFQAIISFIDQGGHAKLGTKGIISSTNDAETVLTHVKNASKWQCHKGLTTNVLKEFCGVEKISLGKEVKSIAKTVGIAAVGGSVVGAVAFGIAVAAGVSAVFPPLGIAIGLGVGAAAGVAAIASLSSFIYKCATQNSAQKARFGKLQKENSDLVAEEKANHIQLQGGRDQKVDLHQDKEVEKDEKKVGEWRLTRSASASNLRELGNSRDLPRSRSEGDMRRVLNKGRQEEIEQHSTSGLGMNPSSREDL